MGREAVVSGFTNRAWSARVFTAVVAMVGSLALVTVGSFGASAGAAASPHVTSSSGPFTPLTPTRLLDTRGGIGAPEAAVAPGASLVLAVDGHGGVPASGVSAVVLNVTVTQPTTAGHITVYPDGTGLPLAANLNFVAGQTIPNLVVAEVGANGNVDLNNGSTGTVQLIADVSGWFAGGGSAANGAFTPVTPDRLLDTRGGIGAPKATVAPGASLVLDVDGQGGIPASGVSAVVLNVTVTQPTTAGHITLYPDGTALPLAANLNFVAGQTIPNLVVAPVGADGRVDLNNGSTGTVQLIADVSGYFSGTGSSSGSFTPLTPTRLLDTRGGIGAPKATVAPGASLVLAVDGHGGVPASGVSAVVLNVTVTQPTTAGHITVYPDGTGLPLAANLNFVAGQTIPNLVVAPVGANGRVDLNNGSTGTVQLIADVSGYFSGVPLGAAVKQLVGNDGVYCSMFASGGVDCWGDAVQGELGDGSFGVSDVPVRVSGVGGAGTLSGVASLATDGTGFCAVLSSRGVDCWGYGGEGELGNGTFGESDVPRAVSGVGGTGTLSGVSSLNSYDDFDGDAGYCALLTSGGVDCWGFGLWGQLGDGVFHTTGSEGSDVPVAVVGVGGSGTLSGVRALDSQGSDGYTTFCAVLTSGGVDCWGYGYDGELGNGTFGNQANSGSAVPVAVEGIGGSGSLSGVSSLSRATRAFCAILTSGGVDCWGAGANGQLGNGSPGGETDTPTAVEGIGGVGNLTGVTSLLATDESVCATVASGGVDCWGSIFFGTSAVPIAIQNTSGVGDLTGATGLAGSYGVGPEANTFCAGLNSGGVDCWSTGSAGNPVAIAVVEGIGGSGTLSGVATVTGNDENFCASLTSGGAACWGQGQNGELGNGAFDNSTFPVTVAFA